MPSRYSLYNFLSPRMTPVYQAIADHLAKALSCRFEVIVAHDYAQVAQADFSLICSLAYLPRQDQLEPLAAPILIGARYQNRPIYFSDVIVQRDSPAHTFDDLRGCSWAYNEPESQSGYGITRFHLLTIGEICGFFGQVIEAGSHRNAIAMVINGQIDAAAIDSHVLELALRDDPTLGEEIRIVASLGPSTIQPLVAARWLPAALRLDVQQVLVSMHHDADTRARLATGLIDRFIAVDDPSYDDIRAMREACARADFLTLR